MDAHVGPRRVLLSGDDDGDSSPSPPDTAADTPQPVTDADNPAAPASKPLPPLPNHAAARATASGIPASGTAAPAVTLSSWDTSERRAPRHTSPHGKRAAARRREEEASEEEEEVEEGADDTDGLSSDGDKDAGTASAAPAKASERISLSHLARHLHDDGTLLKSVTLSADDAAVFRRLRDVALSQREDANRRHFAHVGFLTPVTRMAEDAGRFQQLFCWGVHHLTSMQAFAGLLGELVALASAREGKPRPACPMLDAAFGGHEPPFSDPTQLLALLLFKLKQEQLQFETTLRAFGARGDDAPTATCLKLFEVGPDALPDPGAKLLASCKTAARKDKRLGLGLGTLSFASTRTGSRGGGSSRGSRRGHGRGGQQQQQQPAAGGRGGRRNAGESTRAQGAGASS